MSEAAERDRLKEWAEAQGFVVGGGVDYANAASFSFTGTDGDYLVTVTKGVVEIVAAPAAPEPAPEPAPKPVPKPVAKPASKPAPPAPEPVKEPVKAVEKPAKPAPEAAKVTESVQENSGQQVSRGRKLEQ